MFQPFTEDGEINNQGIHIPYDRWHAESARDKTAHVQLSLETSRARIGLRHQQTMSPTIPQDNGSQLDSSDTESLQDYFCEFLTLEMGPCRIQLWRSEHCQWEADQLKALNGELLTGKSIT